MKENSYSAPAAYRTLEILEFMAANHTNINITDMAKKLEISTNSIFRILKELARKGYVDKDPRDSTYFLTSKLYFLGRKAGKRISFKNQAIPYLKKLNKLTRETVLLATLDENCNTLLVEEIESPEPIKFVSEVGAAYDSYASAFGKVMLAFSPQNIINEYIDTTEFKNFTEFTLTDKDIFVEELNKIKQRGYATDEEESCRGLHCIAFPVFDYEEKCIGSIGISALSFRLGINKFNDYITEIKNASIELSLKSGASNEFLNTITK